MLTLKTILPLTAIFVIGGGASAYAGNPADKPTDPAPTAFEAADVDQNGCLNRGEFMAYAEAKAGEGDPVYADLVASADYDLAFAERDLNADGMVDRGELGENQEAMSNDMKDMGLELAPKDPYGNAGEE